jgi:hypothetical protein
MPARKASSPDLPGWSIRFHFALDEADDDGSIMWSADHDTTSLRVASSWEPAGILGGFDRRGIDAAYDVLDAAVAAAHQCLTQLHHYARRRNDPHAGFGEHTEAQP